MRIVTSDDNIVLYVWSVERRFVFGHYFHYFWYTQGPVKTERQCWRFEMGLEPIRVFP